MNGFFEGASRGLDRGFGLGAELYKDAKSQKERELIRAAEAERQARKDQLAESNIVRDDARWEQEMALKRQAMEQKPGAGAPGATMTPGRKSADMAFGKEYADWSSGGLAATEKGLSALESAKTRLKQGGITGPLRGAVPDAIRAFTNPESVDVKENIRAAVQNTLKATLGAQFTEKEGERIFNFAYNDRLPVEQNIARIDRLIKEIKQTQESKQSMADYFEQHGTLTGWQGRPVSAAGIGMEEPAPQAQGKRYQILSVE